MSSREQLIQQTIDLHREIVRAGLTRHDLLKMGLLGAGTGLLLPIPGLSLRAAWAGGSCPVPGKDIISPPTRPWLEKMPRLEEKRRVAGNDPASISVGNGGGRPGADPVGTLTGGDSKFVCIVILRTCSARFPRARHLWGCRIRPGTDSFRTQGHDQP